MDPPITPFWTTISLNDSGFRKRGLPNGASLFLKMKRKTNREENEKGTEENRRKLKKTERKTAEENRQKRTKDRKKTEATPFWRPEYCPRRNYY